PFTVEAHGTEGSLLYGTPDEKIQIRSTHINRPVANGWNVWTAVPPDQPTAFEQWVNHIQQGTRPQEHTQIAVDLSMLLEAANLSARRNQPVQLDSLAR
ncbi:MAG TPA: gfo/Idh/MocA family oxidoreductase, partial [Ktedonobacteraceae bacterium]|nr:gfo/Idh/MocA family oxidoreductase [Ktedonobacteraceae bacterium]